MRYTVRDNRTKYGSTSATSLCGKWLEKNSTTYTFHVRSYVTAGGNTTYGEMQSVTAYTKGGVCSRNAVGKHQRQEEVRRLHGTAATPVAGYEIQYRSSSADGTYKKIAVVPNGKGAIPIPRQAATRLTITRYVHTSRWMVLMFMELLKDNSDRPIKQEYFMQEQGKYKMGEYTFQTFHEYRDGQEDVHQMGSSTKN